MEVISWKLVKIGINFEGFCAGISVHFLWSVFKELPYIK